MTVRHLDRAVMQGLVEGEAPGGPIRAHLEECRACRDEVEALRAVWQALAAVDVPEPSPLFWTHFAARVGRAIRDEAAAGEGMRRGHGAWRRWWLPAGALAGAVAVLWLARLPGGPGRDTPAAGAGGTPPLMVVTQTSEALDTSGTADGGEDLTDAWELILSAAGDEPWEAEQFAVPVRAGAAEDAAGDLSEAEQVELERLLRRELGLKAG